MKKYRLTNGIKILFEKNNSKSVSIEIMFKVGSNYETAKVAGISHFLEHMLFEGTKKRKSSTEIANEIEKYGAEFNAYTTGDRTAFFIKIINKRFDKALEILTDMIKNSVFNEKIMEKEKKVILKEINMVTDDPRQHQWILFHRNLFEKHPTKNSTYGTKETVKAINRKALMNYFNKYYLPNNMIVSIVGNVNDVKDKTSKYFSDMKLGKITLRRAVNEPKQNKPKKFVEKRKINNSYMVLGYKTTTRLDNDSYTLDVIYGILARGQSGWLFDEIRNKRGLAYQVGAMQENEKDYGYFAVYTGLDKSNIEKARKIILEQFGKLKNIDKKELEDAKTYIEGSHTLAIEDNFHLADNNAYWESIKDSSLAKSYIKNIKKVTVDDVKRVAKKYFNDKYTLVVIEQK
ncbi:insulinase family protein [Candidatus Woesearchaeota archaeon]|nr:insulinase family protein [Candidatus Woesearchaeota archaeon]